MKEEGVAEMARVKRVWFPVGVVLVLGALVVWAFATEQTLRVAYVMGAVALAVLLTGAWWCFFSGEFRRRSLVGGVAVLAVLILAGKMTLRWDGSLTGAMPFRLVWKWTPGREAGLEELAPVTAPEEEAALFEELSGDWADFPRFLGVAGDGVVEDPGLARDGKAGEPRELWRIRVGVGFSSFAVSGRQAVTQEQRGEAELVTCYEVTTGKLLWAHRDEARFEEAMGGAGPRATPAIADGTVYAMGATGILNVLDLRTGRAKWSKRVLEENGLKNLEWGWSASPLVVDDVVVVTGGMAEEGGQGKAVVFAYGREDGGLRWSYGPGPASYSSPCLLEVGGERQVVVVLGAAVVGLDPETGVERWRFAWPGAFPKVAQPLRVSEDTILVTSAYGVESHLLRIAGTGVEPVWSAKQMKTKFSSPVVKGGFAYGLDEGKLICMDLTNGKRVWKGDRFGYGQNLLVGDLLLIQAESGEVVLTLPRPEEHEELVRWPVLQGKTWNAPALAGRYLLVRNDVEAVCLRLP